MYPSVQHLLKENGIPKEKADEIPATGPNGRLLKGDVLAYMGKIKETHTVELSKRIAKLAHLDLSNIKMKVPQEVAPKAQEKQEAASVDEPEVEVALPVSLNAVLECQQRLAQDYGRSVPVTTFIEHATRMANEHLPRSAIAKPTADELFNAVLGLEKAPKYSRGNFTAKFVPPTVAPMRTTAQKSDILDILSGKKPAPKPAKAPTLLDAHVPNLFTVSVPKGDERRGRVFLQRLKSILETGPGQLVA